MPKKTTTPKKKPVARKRVSAKKSGAAILFGSFGLALLALLFVKFLLDNYMIVAK